MLPRFCLDVGSAITSWPIKVQWRLTYMHWGWLDREATAQVLSFSTDIKAITHIYSGLGLVVENLLLRVKDVVLVRRLTILL